MIIDECTIVPSKIHDEEQVLRTKISYLPVVSAIKATLPRNVKIFGLNSLARAVVPSQN